MLKVAKLFARFESKQMVLPVGASVEVRVEDILEKPPTDRKSTIFDEDSFVPGIVIEASWLQVGDGDKDNWAKLQFTREESFALLIKLAQTLRDM